MFDFFKEYFRLSNTEFKGIIALCILIVLIFVSPKVLRLFKENEIKDDKLFQEWIASFDVDEEIEETSVDEENPSGHTSYYTSGDKDNFSYTKDEDVDVVLQDFNPNTATHTELRTVGIPSNVSHTIINFRESGGKFYKAEDLKKVYGITDEIYAVLLPYIKIPKEEYEWEKKVEDEIESFVIVNINTADSAQLTVLKGIGKTYAARIVKYRDLLGGFHNKEQLKEVYGIDEDLYLSLQENISVSGSLSRLSINEAGIDQLKTHPYIDYTTAKAIVNYREQHGDYTSLDDLDHLYALDAVLLAKIKPYLKI